MTEKGESEVVELTEFQTTTQLKRCTAESSLYLYKCLPFVDQTPKDLLSRPYTIKTETLSGSAIQFYNPLALWLAKPDVITALTYFNYIKFKLVIRHQITSAFELYGYILAGYYYGNNENYDFDDIFTTDCFISSISAVEPIEYEIAYNSPSSYTPFRNPDFVDSYCRAFIRNDVTHSVGGASQVQMKTIVTAEDIEVGGYTGVRVQASRRTANPLPDMFKNIENLVGGTAALSVAGLTSFLEPLVSGMVTPGHGGPHQGDSGITESATAAGAQVGQSLYGDLVNPTYSKQRQNMDRIPNGMPNFTGHHDYDLTTLLKLPGTFNAQFVNSEGLVFSHKLGQMEGIENTWLYFIRNCFRFWAGSVKVVLWFFTTPLVSARFKVSVSYSYVDSQATAPLDDYSVPTKQFLVRGDHREELIIPYHAWVPCFENAGANNIYGVLELYCIQRPNEVSAGNQGGIKVLATISGCDDNVLYSTRHFYYPQTTGFQELDQPVIPSLTKVQASLRQVHASPDGHNFGLGAPINYPDYMVPVKKLSELIGRYDDRPGNDSSFLNIILPLSTIGVQAIDPVVSNLDYIASAFAFRRGSMQFKLGYVPEISGNSYTFSNTLSPTMNVVVSTTDNRTANGQFVANTSIWSVADVTIPYLSCYHHLPVVNSIVTVENIQPLTDAPIGSLERVLVRAGPDFQLSHPNILPKVPLDVPG